ncbi:MAG: hypothetical protein CMK36_03190 [Porticoccaceae bacterium]|nr:hypothetical protein [Porticoccaceae bacterium]|tara:strand:+ start:81 stop:800 length:720 start_codon:yes stop_codon:yes gene_type:complete
MFLIPFYSRHHNGFTINKDQGSKFAKEVCNDFNPLHDVENKRFCVPGDLLFALTLKEYGISQKMCFSFCEMLSAAIPVSFKNDVRQKIKIVDENGNKYLGVDVGGRVNNHVGSVKSLILSYVRFSGENFPNILVPLMAENGVMINPFRPLVIYQSMSLIMNELIFEKVSTEIGDVFIKIRGNRAEVSLSFSLNSKKKIIGAGTKNLIIAGVRPYDKRLCSKLVDEYVRKRDTYLTPEHA